MGNFINLSNLSLNPTLSYLQNCVLLADTIVGQAGTDILSPKGFIAPGTYQAYLNREFEKPNSIVVSKHVY